jgi:DNA polymerase-3 subunit gamma/tau
LDNQQEYQVLARKYRPKELSGLIGQDVLVQTLTNAIENDRIPHAFIMTGIRGVGKTSTARIIARSLVCVGKDGKQNKPTTTPCGECEQCKAVAEDRHVDILEMDAASRTGVGDIREIIDSVNYSPVMGRYKIYIIDEVHMLSKSAFNALLKTLEEPPEHTKFIFATTEIRKIPVTVLSRCMRFDLARVSVELLNGHLKNIAQLEGATIADDALTLISHAAEGSVRDALSLLDQAIGISARDEKIGRELVSRMLGVADSGAMYDLFGDIVAGKPKEAIECLRRMYMNGADPVTVLHDLLDMSHFITQLKVIPEMANASHLAETDKARGTELASALSVAYLSRMWQMLLKGVGEVQTAPNSLVAAEMILVRLTYVSDVPPPNDLIKKIEKGEGGSLATSAPMANAAHASPSPALSGMAEAVSPAPVEYQKTVEPADGFIRNPLTFNELVELFKSKGEGLRYGYLLDLQLVKFDAANGQIEFNPMPSMPASFAGEMGEMLTRWTGERWVFIVSNGEGQKSLRKIREEEMEAREESSKNDAAVKVVMDAFPDARIVKMVPLKKQSDKSADVVTLAAKTNKN